MNITEQVLQVLLAKIFKNSGKQVRPNQCIGGLEQFLSREQNQGSVDFKTLSPPTGNQKVPQGTLQKKKITEICEKPWKYGKITEFCHYGKVETLFKSTG